MQRSIVSVIFTAALLCTAYAHADDSAAPPPTKHQLMKECMAKEKASDGGIPKEDMKKNCKDVTTTESENEKAEKQEESAEKSVETPQT